MCGGRMPKQRFIAMVGDSKLHRVCDYLENEYWSEHNRARNNDIDDSNGSKLIELIFKEELHCFQGSFRKQTGREDIETCEP